MNRKFIIAIDGPAASGKSTTARELAKRLHYVYIDTGAMYRACALRSLKSQIPLTDEVLLRRMMDSIQVDIEYHPEGNRILLHKEDVSLRIREEDISRLSSEIATIGFVRTKMVELQRKLGAKGGVILDGRDIGTVVFPQADFKFFMTASVEERARRRVLELRQKGRPAVYDEVVRELRWRDKNDSEREVSPLKKAQDAIEIDTTGLSIDEQVEMLYGMIEAGK